MATVQVSLTESYQLVSSTSILVSIAEIKKGTAMLVNDTSTPASTVVGHSVPQGEPRVFPAPAAGNWYAKVTSDTATLAVTEV